MARAAANNAAAVAAFTPVIHAGYLAFFAAHPAARAFVFGRSLVADFPRLERDIRAIPPEVAAAALADILGRPVAVLEKAGLAAALKGVTNIALPDEDVSEHVAALLPKKIEVTLAPTFLRWDKKITDREFEVPPHRIVTTDELAGELMGRARQEAGKSPDWWRQIGAVLSRDGQAILFSHNCHVPHPRVQDALGDPRLNFDAGERLDTYLSVHAEMDILVQAAKAGISVAGADLYATTFPCANCARALSRSGIKRLFYADGYSRLDAEPILTGAGIDIILVKEKESGRPSNSGGRRGQIGSKR